VVELDAAKILQRLDELERAQAQLRVEKERVAEERDGYKKLYLEMMERCRKLERGLMGQKAERTPAHEGQLALSVLGTVLGDQAAQEIEALAAPRDVKAHKRAKPTGRTPLPETLPRVDIEILPDEVKRDGLDAFERIGEEVAEVLERRPASLVVARVIRPKFVRKDRDRAAEKIAVFVSEPAELPIMRGRAGPGMLADTIVKRWQDHLPLNRLEGIYARDGVELARSTICGWHLDLAELATPLVAAMRADAFKSPFLCADATGVLVQAPEQCRRGHFWVVVAPKRHVLFEYTRSHDSNAVDSVLAGFEGYLVLDAHVVYDHLFVDTRVTEVNCWAHARRYFFKAIESEPIRALEALQMINLLFKIERSIATAPRKKREAIRAKHSAPVVERFYSWCDEIWPTLLEESPLYDGVRYARNQRTGLSRFLSDGRLPLDNNISERELRRQAVGRKNWLFVGSDDGAQANAVFTSLLASCRMLGVEPWSYLRDLFCLLPSWPKHRLLELAPVNWHETREREDVQALLTANVFRGVTLLPA
jgi:transposase